MPTQEQTESLPPSDSAGAIQSADELHDGDRVVYPKQGVCRVIGRQAKEISGMKLEFIALAREEDSASILVPVAKVPTIGLRKVADTNELGDVFDLLASSFDDPELDWKVRHRMHGDLMSAGGILGVAEVLKALQALANMRPLPQKERERYDAARHLLVDEIAVALGVPHATAEDYIDLALIPPPGVVRPAAKPRRLATLPAKPLRPVARTKPRGEDEEFGEIGLDDELDLGEEEELPPEEEETAEGEGEGEEEAEAEEAEEAPRRKAKAPAAAKEKKPAAKKAAPKATAAKKSTKKADDGEAAAKPKKAPAKKKAAAEGEEKPKRAPAKKKAAASAEGDEAGETAAPARKTTRAKKSE